jgi:hypothetical protein
MNDPTVPPSWLTYLLGAVVALLASIFEYYRRKVDKIEGVYMSKEDFQKYMQQMREDRQLMHADNQARLKDIGDGMNRVHVRIDQIFSADSK